MSQTVITLAFEKWKAQQAVDDRPLTLDRFIFANVPGLDPARPIDRAEGLPPAAQIVHRQAVSMAGVVNENAVVYSVTLGADVGDFAFNWIGLVNAASNTLAMVVHAPIQQKIRNAAGQQGNVLVRSFMMEYNGAATETQITTPAETWQIDFTARLSGIDERQRLENTDIYGAGAFFGDGYLVKRSGSSYSVAAGTGYVGGLRTALDADQALVITKKPVRVWVDVCWQGTLTSVWHAAAAIRVAADLADYVADNVQHYVFAVAEINADGSVTDLRPAGSLAEQSGKMYLRRDNNLSDVNDKAKARSALGLGNSAVRNVGQRAGMVAAGDDNRIVNAVQQSRTINGHALENDINISAQDIYSQVVEIGDGQDLNKYAQPGLYVQPMNTRAAAGKNYPEPLAGTLEIFRSAGIIQIYRLYNSSRCYTRTLYMNEWSLWQRAYDTGNKPTAADVGAIPLTGSDKITGVLRTSAEIQTTSPQSFRMINDEYGVFWRQDGSKYYLMLTAQGNPNGGFNALRPFFVDLASGNIATNQAFHAGDSITASKRVIPGDYTNFDERYYTKKASDASFMPRTGAYTKAESDARFNLKNTALLGPSGWTRDESTGFILQWGIVKRAGDRTLVTFPRAFPNACTGIFMTKNETAAGGNSQSNMSASPHSTSQFNVWMYALEKSAYFMAIGN